MPGFRDRRITLLVLALIISGLFIAAPWKDKDSQPSGAPFPNRVKGPNWGIDITGGTRILLRLEATEVTVQLPQNSTDYADNFMQRIREDIESPITQLGKDNVAETGKITIEIGRHISENSIKKYLKNNEEITSLGKGKVSQYTQERVQNSLETRVDPYGTLGAQLKPLGRQNQYLQFEVSLPLDRAKKLLGEEGLPEVFVENRRVIWSRHIRNVQKSLQEGKWGVSFTLTDEGKERFADFTGRKPDISDKKGHPGVIYLDRPNNAVILLRENLLDSLKNEIGALGMEETTYSESAHRLKYKTGDNPTTPLDEGHWFHIQVPIVTINNNQLSKNDENYILSLINEEEINRAIFLGKKKTLPDQLIQNDNLILDNTTIPIENSTRIKERNETTFEWTHRVFGIESWPTLQPSITANVENLGRGLRISTGGEGEAEDLRIILSQRLPVKVTHISETEIGGRLSQGFIREAAKAGAIAFLVVGVLVYIFYRRFKIAIPLLLTMACEVIITLGAASAVPDGLMSIGLPGIGGLIAVIGTGVDHQIIIADEVLGEKFSESERLPIDRRTGKAFTVIFAAAATTIAAMFALAAFGFGAMRGFAIVTLFGVLISVLITRPAYARIIGTLLEMEQNKNSGGS